MKVDLNCDLGESFGAYKIGRDADIIPLISSANIACGFHAGDPLVLSDTVRCAVKAGIRFGAHPGYPDLVGFGRRNMDISPRELKAVTQYQIGALQAFAAANHVRLQHVKPHGAMYNTAAKNEALADAICEAIAEVDGSLILLGLSGSQLLKSAEKYGLRAASEVFADRAYEEDGSLVSRSKPGAVIQDADLAISRVVRMVKEGVVESVSGKVIPIQADSICVHGDNAHALEFTARIRKTLEAEGVEIVPLAEL